MKDSQVNKNITLPSTVRLTGLVIICIFISRILSLSTPLAILCVSALFGDYFGRYLSRKQVKIYKIFIGHAVVYPVFIILTRFIETIVISGNSPANDFVTYRWAEQLSMSGIFYVIALVTALGYWRLKSWANYEAILVFSAVIYALGGHRKYFLDAPKSISSLAWDLGLEPQYLLIAIGLLTSGLVSLYLIVSSTRSIFGNQNTIYERLPSSKWRSALMALIYLATFLAWGFYVNKIYSSDMTRAMNGVGQSAKEGESPLGFHSALGQTKQPAALLRLESGYNKNPWIPMLYIRESAISEYNGRELVTASTNFDQDIVRQRSFDTVRIDSTVDSKSRQEVTQSIYLLSAHSTPFAIDYPVTLRQLRNPDPQRFVGAYQVLSQAPTKTVNDLTENNVGNSSWSADQWTHYLRAPGSLASLVELQVLQSASSLPSLTKAMPDSNREDLRYKILSNKITAGISSPVAKAEAIVTFLSENSIYTRSPGHEITKDGDPVAPYLFSEEMRGYCVHFAHAAVYLMRLAGIPARIATGYLADLNYSKDGHVLLTMADRHAWPEIYVENVGWVVADVSPARAENEQPPVPDEKLLEELMSKLDPAEALASPFPANKEKTTVTDFLKFISLQKLFLITCLILAIFIFTKFTFRYCYLLAIGPRQTIRFIYFSLLADITDLGNSRYFGETRQEFCSRILESKKINLKAITDIYEKLCYQKDFDYTSPELVALARHEARASIRANYRFPQRLLAFFSVRSIIGFRRL